LSIRKIAIIGPESTGKSTLSKTLAAELHTVWVPEYARSYLETLQREYVENDLLLMAQGQMAQEDILIKNADAYLICDTDLHVLKVWSEHKYHRCHPWILEQIAQRKYDMYLLTYIDIEWSYDPQREHPDTTMRKYFYNIYRDIVQNSGLPWVDIRGGEHERLHTAKESISQILNNTTK